MGAQTVGGWVTVKAAATAVLVTAAGAVVGFVAAFLLAALAIASGLVDDTEWNILICIGAGLMFGLAQGGLLGATVAWGRGLTAAAGGPRASCRRLAVVCAAGLLAMLGSAWLAWSAGSGALRHQFGWALVLLWAPPTLTVLAAGYLTRAWPVGQPRLADAPETAPSRGEPAADDDATLGLNRTRSE